MYGEKQLHKLVNDESMTKKPDLFLLQRVGSSRTIILNLDQSRKSKNAANQG